MVRFIIAACCLIATIAISVIEITPEIKKAGLRREQFIARKIKFVDSDICASKPQIPYFLGQKWVMMPWKGVFDSCSVNNIDWLLIRKYDIKYRPTLENEIRTNKNFTVVAESDDFALFRRIR